MIPTKILFPFALLTVIFSCKAKKKGDRIINMGLGEIHLANQEAENDFNKGLFYIRHQNYSAAKDFFLQADEESPNTVVILNAIGDCMDRADDSSQGFFYFKKALKIDSSFINTYINYGCSLNNRHRFDEAEKFSGWGYSDHNYPHFTEALCISIWLTHIIIAARILLLFPCWIALKWD